MYHENLNQKKVGVNKLVSGEADFMTRKLWGKEGNYITTKMSILEEDTLILDVYVLTQGIKHT